MQPLDCFGDRVLMFELRVIFFLKKIVLEISFSFSKISVSLHSPYSTIELLLILDIFEIGY